MYSWPYNVGNYKLKSRSNEKLYLPVMVGASKRIFNRRRIKEAEYLLRQCVEQYNNYVAMAINKKFIQWQCCNTNKNKAKEINRDGDNSKAETMSVNTYACRHPNSPAEMLLSSV